MEGVEGMDVMSLKGVLGCERLFSCNLIQVSHSSDFRGGIWYPGCWGGHGRNELCFVNEDEN